MNPTSLVDELLEQTAERGMKLDVRAAEFAVRFTSLMLDIALADRDLLASERSAMVDALDTWTGLGEEAIDLAIDVCLDQRTRRVTSEESAEAAAEFARRYDLGSALLVLDGLFGVATAEGTISDEELSHLENIARALQVDPTLFARFRQRWTPAAARGDMVVPLAGRRLRIGRDRSCEIQLDDAQLAAHHATLVRRGDDWWIESVSRACRIYLEDRQIDREKLGAADRVRIGRFWLRLVFDRGEVHVFSSTTASALTVRDLVVSIPTTAGRKTIVEGISFTVFAGELVALIGPSGSGKTTLLSAISGVRPFDSGDVLLDGDPFLPLLQANRHLVGEVPQEDIVHPLLTVRESLWYSARLRLAPDLKNLEIARQVNRVLGELDIRHIRDSVIGDTTRRGISGGQRKRVNLGQELLTQSTHILFLDEPTSGLDPHSSREIVSQVRKLSDRGRIIFLVTHDLSPQVVEMVDQVMVLTEDGRQAFFGPPQDACKHFNVERLDEIFDAIHHSDQTEISENYLSSEYFRQYVRTREKVLGVGPVSQGNPRAAARRSGSTHWLRQLRFLAARYIRAKVRDRGGMAILLLQAPILAVIMAIVFPQVDPSALFIISLATLWFGCSAAVREVIAELPIIRRERRAGLRFTPYVGSKYLSLLAICALQCLLLVGILYPALKLYDYGFNPLLLFTVALLTASVGIALGLQVSSLFSSSEAAVGTLPLILIPQIVFGGLIVYVKEMPTLARWLSYGTATRWSFNALLATGDELFKPGAASYEKVEIPMSGILYLLGFKTTTDVLDRGLPLALLCSVLAGMTVLLLATTMITLTVRSRRLGL